MALILQKAWHGYVFLFEEVVDPRTKSWPLVAKPYQGLAFLALYLMFVLKWGPQWMKNRAPFNLDKALIIYNVLQIIACVYLFVNGLRLAWLWHYKWVCEPVDFSYGERALDIARLVYVFFMIKISDLLDTIFFVLRKKTNQISFLHVYHHAGMFLVGWGVTTYLPGGHGTLIGIINAFVHIVMYSYYLLTVATPSIRKAAWIKKIVTQVQIVQFFWCAMHMALIVFRNDCGYPRWTAAVMLPQNLFMLVLFLDFYIKTYLRKPKERVNGKVKLNDTENHNSNQYSAKKDGYDGNNNIYENDKKKIRSANNGFKSNVLYKQS